MKKLLLLLSLLLPFNISVINAEDGKNNGDELLRESKFFDITQPGNTSFPSPFTELDNPSTKPGVTTGYFFVDSESDIEDNWRPRPIIVDTTEDPTNWYRILSGPRQVKGSDGNYRTYWEEH